MTWPITPLESIHVDPTALATIQLQFRAAYTALESIFAQLPAEIIDALVNVILTTFGFGAVSGDVNALLAALQSALLDIPQGNISGLVADLATAGSALIQALIDLICNALGVPGSGHTDVDLIAALENFPLANLEGFLSAFGSSFPATFPITFGTSTSLNLADLVPVAQFQALLDGIANNGILGHTVDSAVAAWQQAQQAIPSNISQAIQDGVAGIEGVGAAITQTFSNFPGTNVQGISGDTIVADLQSVVDGGVNALNATTGVVGHTVTDFEAGLADLLTTQFNNWTGGSKASAGAADLSAAALSAAEQAASLSGQLSAIAAQLPHFYGGAGAAGIGIEVEFTAGVPQGAGNSFTAISSTQSQYNGTNGYDSTAASQTDSESVSGIWSTIIPANTWRGVYLRANTAGTTRVWAQWHVVGDPDAEVWGSYYVPNDTTAYFELQIGCTVAGTPTVLQTFGPYPLWAYAGEVVITGYSIQYVGEWWANYPAYLPTYGSGYSARKGYSLYLNSGNNAIFLEATADTFAIGYPSAGELSTIDTAPVSLMGSLYRQAGFTDDAGVPGSQVSWAFWDSGPTAGPQAQPLATSQHTGSTSWTDLTTVGPSVTVNVGLSKMALVTVSAALINDTDGCGAEMGFAVSGANTIAAGVDQNTLRAGAYTVGASATTLVTDLSLGPTTFTAKYQAIGGGLATFSDRDITAIPL